MLPEEKMAARVLKMRKLQPPYDLFTLAREYGNLELKKLPSRVDGITVGIGKKAKPLILISNEISVTRQHFTLAHEIGHIVIPWHVGTVVSHIEPGDVDLDYRQMEMEANRFAAELLMPSIWIQDQFDNSVSFEKFFRSVVVESGASRDAAFFKILRHLDAPTVFARLDQVTGRVQSIVKSPTAPNLPNNDLIPKFRGLDYDCEKFKIQGNQYHSWVFKGKQISDVDPRSWREILNEILVETGLEQKLQSINAILATAVNKCKDQDEPEICGMVIRSFSTRKEIHEFWSHKLFEQYVIKRVKELKSRK